MDIFSHINSFFDFHSPFITSQKRMSFLLFLAPARILSFNAIKIPSMVWQYRQKHNINVSIAMLYFFLRIHSISLVVFLCSPPLSAFTKLALISSDKQTLELKIQLMRGVWKWLCCAAAAVSGNVAHSNEKSREFNDFARMSLMVYWIEESTDSSHSISRAACLDGISSVQSVHTRTIRKWDMSVPYILKPCWIEKERELNMSQQSTKCFSSIVALRAQ